MAINKVVYGDDTLIDLTSDTVTTNSLLSGATAHGANGERISGTVTVPTKTSDLINDSGFITGIPFGVCDSTSTATVFTATVPGITELADGTCVMLQNGVVTSASGFTININNLGAKPVYSNMATGNAITPTAPTRETTIFNINYTLLLIYSEDLVEGGAWINYRGYNSDNNTIGYQLRTNSTVMKTADGTRYYRMFFTSANGTHWVPANTAKDNSATSTKTVNQRPIDPFGRIIYYSTTTNFSAESDINATYCWEQYAFSFGYSFNRTGAALTMTTKAPVYLKCAPQSDGSAIIDSTTPYVQALPSTADGKIYIFLGIAYSATNIELFINHPVYYHDGTGIRLWTGKTIPTKTSELTNDSGFLTSAPVTSVNGQTGAVVLDADDVGALPDDTVIPTKTSDLTNDSGFITSVPVQSVNGQTGAVVLNANDVGALPSSTAIPSKVSDLTNDSGFVNAAQAATAAPVQSVNGQTGMVVLDADDVGALPSSTIIPSKVSDLTNDSGFINSTQAAAAAPVQSVNGQTGVVVLDADDVGALPSSTVIPSKVSDLTNDSGFINTIQAAAAAPVQSVNGSIGVVELDADDIGAISDPSTKSDGQVLTWDSTAGEWIADTTSASVYIGTSAPTDSSIDIWFDTDEPGMSVVSSVNGKTGTVVLNASDVGALPKKATVSIPSSWTTNSNDYTVTATVTGAAIDSNSKVDLQPDTSIIQQLITDDVIALYIDNNNGILTAHAIGAAPTAALTIQCTVMEVS